jgi:hypothetical protein
MQVGVAFRGKSCLSCLRAFALIITYMDSGVTVSNVPLRIDGRVFDILNIVPVGDQAIQTAAVIDVSLRGAPPSSSAVFTPLLLPDVHVTVNHQKKRRG